MPIWSDSAMAARLLSGSPSRIRSWCGESSCLASDSALSVRSSRERCRPFPSLATPAQVQEDPRRPGGPPHVLAHLFERVRQAGGELEGVLPETGWRIVQESIRRRQRHAQAFVYRKSQADAAGREIRAGVVPRRRSGDLLVK